MISEAKKVGAKLLFSGNCFERFAVVTQLSYTLYIGAGRYEFTAGGGERPTLMVVNFKGVWCIGS